MNTDSTKGFIDEFWDQRALPALKEYISIPCKSPTFDANWKQNGHLNHAVEHCKQWCESLGIAGLNAQSP